MLNKTERCFLTENNHEYLCSSEFGQETVVKEKPVNLQCANTEIILA